MNYTKTLGDIADWESCPPKALRAGGAKTVSPEVWLSNLKVYRFPLAIAVLAVHAGQFVLRRASENSAATGMGGWLVSFLTLASMLATPSFLVIAGFLFFRDGPVSMPDYERKLRSRFYTLLIPYLVWNLIAILVSCAPPVTKYYLLGIALPPDTSITLHAIARWFVGWPIFPADAPLWFVRDLLILVLAAPLFNRIPKHLMGPGIVLVGLYWFFGPVGLIPGGIPRACSVFFFSIGAWLGINRIRFRDSAGTRVWTGVSAAVFFISAGVGAALGGPGVPYSKAQVILENLTRTSGMMLVLLSAARTSVPTRFSAFLGRLSSASFFVYAVHYCVLICLLEVIEHFGPAPFGLGYGFGLFSLLCFTILALSLGCYYVLKSAAPSVLGVLDGNRSTPGERPDSSTALPHAFNAAA